MSPSSFKILLFPGLPLSLLTRENSDLCFLAASCVKLNPWKGSFPGGEVLLLRARVEDKCEMDVWMKGSLPGRGDLTDETRVILSMKK